MGLNTLSMLRLSKIYGALSGNATIALRSKTSSSYRNPAVFAAAAPSRSEAIPALCSYLLVSPLRTASRIPDFSPNSLKSSSLRIKSFALSIIPIAVLTLSDLSPFNLRIKSTMDSVFDSLI